MVDNRYQIQDQAFVVTLVINVVITVIGLLLFSILRRRYQSFYHYRYTESQKGISTVPPTGLFSWITDTIRYDQKKVLDITGLDGYIYLRSVKTFLYISLLLMIISAAMLYPTNYFGTFNEGVDPAEQVVGLSLISMANISRGSSLMWVHLVFGFIVTGIVLFFLCKDFYEYTQKRIGFKQTNRIMNYSVFVRDIPKGMYTREGIFHYLNSFFPNQLKDVVLYYPSGASLQKLVNQRETFVKKLEKALFTFRKTNRRPVIKRFVCFGEQKDAITTYQGKIDSLTRDINEKRGNMEQEQEKINYKGKFGGNGVLIFNQRQHAKIVTESIIHRDYPFTFNRYQAPDPNDLYHKNATTIGTKSFFLRTLLVGVFIFFLVFFWSIPVFFLSGFSNLGTLSQISAFSWIVDIITLSPILTGFLQGFLPNLILVIFMALLVPIIAAASRAQGFFSQSSLDRSVLRKYFFFLIFNVFLIYSISGSIFQSIKTIVDHPQEIITMLANSLSGIGFQMINYVMIAAVASFLGVLRLIALIIRNIKLRYFSKTKREIAATMRCGSLSYGILCSKNLLIFQLALAYSTLSPFILIFSSLYFAGVYIVHKYNMIWVSTPTYQSGGQFYPSVFRRSIVSLLIYQLLMIGSFNIFKFFYGILLVIPLVLTLIAWGINEYKFTKLSVNGTMDVNIPPGNEEEVEIFKGSEFHDSSIATPQYVDQYKQPYDLSLMTPDEEENINIEPGYPNT